MFGLTVIVPVALAVPQPPVNERGCCGSSTDGNNTRGYITTKDSVCGTANATGTITVNPNMTAGLR